MKSAIGFVLLFMKVEEILYLTASLSRVLNRYVMMICVGKEGLDDHLKIGNLSFSPTVPEPPSYSRAKCRVR